MKKTKKIISFSILIMAIIILLPNKVSALENPEDLIKMLAPDGENATFKMKKPTSMEEADFTVNGYVQSKIQVNGYYVYTTCDEDGYDACTVEITSDDYMTGSENGKEVVISGWIGSYDINVTYDEPTSNSIVDGYISNLNDFDNFDPSTYYIVEDLSLINYYMTSNKSELWNSGAPGRALKYSTLNNTTSGSNVKYNLDVRAGIQDENLMFESAFGPMSIFYNDYLHGSKEAGLYLKRVIYIPQDTEDTDEAYVEAAQRRINDYLGNSSVTVSYGGLLSSLEEGSEDEYYPITSNGNYYNVKIGTRTYKFYILKGLENQLIEPTYEGVDIESKIEITSSNSTIPLDTSLTVKNVTDNSIKDKIGTENYKSYDISLYSDAKGSKIEKLDTGKFLVKIPVPAELKNKDLNDLIVYYITPDGEVQDHEVTPLEESNGDNYVSFETNHFSIYTLAEKVSLDNNNNVESEDTLNEQIPPTFDGLGNNVFVAFISLTGLLGVSLYLKRY